jgi:hypothetical protein
MVLTMTTATLKYEIHTETSEETKTRRLKHLPRDYGCLLQGVFVFWQISPLARITVDVVGKI